MRPLPPVSAQICTQGTQSLSTNPGLSSKRGPPEFGALRNLEAYTWAILFASPITALCNQRWGSLSHREHLSSHLPLRLKARRSDSSSTKA